MVLRRKLRSTARKVWKKPGLLKGTGSISRTPAIKPLGRKHLQQTLSCESFPLQGVQPANIWGLKWSQCSLCLKLTQTSSSARKTPHTIASLVTSSWPYVVEPCTSRGMKMISGSFLFAILSPTLLAPDACCSAVTHLSLVLGSFGPAVLSLRCAFRWAFRTMWWPAGHLALQWVPLRWLHVHRLDLHQVSLWCAFYGTNDPTGVVRSLTTTWHARRRVKT